MKIYIPHATNFDFQKELYEVVYASGLRDQHEIFLPHEKSYVNTHDLIKTIDLVIAEVSHASTGLGIELGWANELNKPITAIYKHGHAPSSSIKAVTQNLWEYKQDQLITVIKRAIECA